MVLKINDIKGIMKYLNIKEKLISGSQILGQLIFLLFLWYAFFIGIK
tara:strand:- start:319 stop:459 length:141 start_codon:yes stop_codon:yes gene_type:complete